MMPPLLHVNNGLTRPADESLLARDNGTDIGTTGHSENHGENIIASNCNAVSTTARILRLTAP